MKKSLLFSEFLNEGCDKNQTDTVILSPDAVKKISVSSAGLYVDLDRGPWQIRNTEHMLDTINNNTDKNATVTISITIKLSDIDIFGK